MASSRAKPIFRRSEGSRAEVPRRRALEILLTRSIESVHEPAPLRRVTALARQFQLTVYDASYLDLAREKQLPLATLDRALSRAVLRAGVELVT